MQLAKIDGHPTLVRDMSSKHIVQTDLTVVRKHEARSAAIVAQQKRDAEVAAIKADVAELKKMVWDLMTKIAQIPSAPPVSVINTPAHTPNWGELWGPIGGPTSFIGNTYTVFANTSVFPFSTYQAASGEAIAQSFTVGVGG